MRSGLSDSLASTGAERKLATVLFADLVGSTERAAPQDPERTRVVLERFYDAMAEEVTAAGGTVEKFAGDAVMAVFGAPAAQEDHVERALHAALAMGRRLEQLFAGELALRVGVNTGEVVVGRAREQSSFVSGDAVNVAARLEQRADSGQILVGERAARLASGAFEFERQQTITAKGKPDGIACRALVRALSLMRPRGVPGLRSPFVGREQELGQIQAAFERCAVARRSQLVTVIGDTGVGKTRLVRELWQWLGQSAPEALRRTGRCPPYGRAITYQPLGEILKEHYSLDGGRPEQVREQLGSRAILGLALGLDVAADLHPIVARDRLHDAWVDFVQDLTSEQPVVVLVEDLHWAEEPLVELLERTVLEVDGPVLLIGTSRPEFLERSPTWGRGRAPSEWVWLEPLPDTHVQRLVEESVEGAVPEPVAEFLARAEGNPLFLEELIATLLERGALRQEGGWDLGRLPDASAVPESVHSVLAARIDLLPAREKRALQAAAVIGRAFWPAAVRELLEADEVDFRLLEGRDFVRRRTGASLGGEPEFVFKHAITREVAYRSLTIRDRARLHAAYASWLEHRGRDEDAAALALHYAEAVRPDGADLAWADDAARNKELRTRAVVWLRRAAELAESRFEVEEALALLEQALALADDVRSKVDILRQTARTHTQRYDPQGLRAVLEQALELRPDRDTAAAIYAQLAYYALARPYMWKEPPPPELGEEWLAKALELSQPWTETRAYALVARAFSTPGGPEAGEAFEIASALADPRLIVLACEAQAAALGQEGKHADACAWVDRALEAASALGDPGLRAHQYWYACFAYLRAGRVARAPALAAAYDELASSLTVHDRVHAVALHAAISSVLGDWRALAELARRAEETTTANIEFPCQFNWRNLLVCALGRARAGDADEARRLEQLGRESAVVFGPPEREPALLRLALLRGDVRAVREILERVPQATDPFGVDTAAARLDALVELGDAEGVEREARLHVERESYSQPFALRALGAVRRDAALVEQAAARFDAMGLAWRADETRALRTG